MDENIEVECTGKKVQSTDGVYFRRRKGEVKALSYTKNRVFELSKHVVS